ncbi:hypothetical protein [Aquabacterium sp.]|uniref:hypothetical protein n=1 Tax=Aquabacterium sp. TaxID=1872578 RepID=UPI003D6D9363
MPITWLLSIFKPAAQLAPLTPYQRGKSDFWNGTTANPFPAGSVQAMEWDHGRDEAETERAW